MKGCEKKETLIEVKVVPRSSVNMIMPPENGVYRIKLTSPPVDGKANKALVSLLAKRLGIAKRNIDITSGERSRNKRLRIQGVVKEDMDGILG